MLRSHKNIHNIGIFTCELCDFITKNKKNLQIHKRIHIIGIYPCELCNYIAKNIVSLHAHKRTHNIKKIKCNVCDIYFGSKFNLNRHSQRKHIAMQNQEKKIRCSKCSYVTNFPGIFNFHNLSHEKDGLNLFDLITDELKSMKVNSKDEFEHELEYVLNHSSKF